MTTPAERRRTTWPTAEPLQRAADTCRATDPLLADWLDETANAMAWLAPYREHEGGYHMWAAALAVARAISAAPGEGRNVSPTAALLASRCDACRHTLNRHDNQAGCTVPLCVCGRFQPPADEDPS